VIIVFGVFVISLFVGILLTKKRDKYGDLYGGAFACYVVAGMCLVGFLTGIISINIQTVSSIGEQEGFVSSVQVFRQTITETKDAVIILDNKKIIELYSAENINQSTNISERIKELRDKITEYNQWRGSYIRLQRIWFNRWTHPKLPETLKPIEVLN